MMAEDAVEIIGMEDCSMDTQMVQNWMTPHLITITPQTTLPEAQQLMLDSHKCRLQVATPPTHQYYSGKHLLEIQNYKLMEQCMPRRSSNSSEVRGSKIG